MKKHIIRICESTILIFAAYANFPNIEIHVFFYYGIISLILLKNHRRDKVKFKVYMTMLITSLLGVAIRYFTEYGDYFARVSFNEKNIFMFLLIIPLFSKAVYMLLQCFWINESS